MTGYQRVIVVGTNGSAPSAAATRVALELARACGDRVLFVTAWQELRGSWGVPLHHIVPELTEIERDWAESHSAAAVEAAKAAGVPAEGVIGHGDATDVICKVAGEVRPRLVVVGSHGWTAVERVFAGSVADRVTHEAPCAVLVVREPAVREPPAAATSSVGAPC